MSTARTFQTMLNEYLPNELLKEELIKRDYILQNIEKDDAWKGGNLVVPFRAAGASSVAAGALTGSTDIAQDAYVRGGVSAPKEVWGSMIFNQRDLYEHDMVSEQNFLKILPNAVDDFIDYMKGVVSMNLLNGAQVDFLAANANAAGGVITPNKIDRLVIGQKLVLVDPVQSHTVTAYVKSIDMNLGTAIVCTDRTYATTVDFSAVGNTMLLANKAAIYNDGFQTAGNAFQSLRGAFLTAAQGGDSTLYGQSKLAYPYLQAINVDGSSVTGTNLMSKIFDGLSTIRQRGKGNPTDIVMSYKNLAQCMKIVENSKGAFNVVPNSTKTNQYGWMEIEIGSVKGQLKLVGVQECDDDVIMFIDWRALKFHSNGFFRKRVAPDGKEYFEVRNTSGYQYIIDVCLFGEMVVIRPSYCGIMYGVNYTLT